MKRLWFSLLCIAGISFTAVWLASNPGEVVILWFGYRIETSFALIFLAAIVAGWLLVYLYAIIHGILAMPKRFAEKRELNHYKQGLAELTYSVAALAASDMIDAEKHAHKAQKLLGETPMGLLVSAQIAKNQGDHEKAKTLLTQMMDYKETKEMATHLLTDESAPPRKPSWAKKWHRLFKKD